MQERFWSKVDKTNLSGCWLWLAGKNNHGYGRFSINNKYERAHRVAYELVKGPIAEGVTLDHLCRNPACVNPDHLEPVTHRENVLRGKAPPAIHAKKTHCPNGHPLEGENLAKWDLAHGQRKCKICINELQNERKRAKLIAIGKVPQAANKNKTHCPKGHELAGDNLVKSKLPYRICRLCQVDRVRASRAQLATKV